MLSEERSNLYKQYCALSKTWFSLQRVGSSNRYLVCALSRTCIPSNSYKLRCLDSDELFEDIISMLSGNDALVERLRMIRYEGTETVIPCRSEWTQRVFYLYNADLELFTHEEKCAVKAAMMVLMDKVKDQIKDILQQMFLSDDDKDVVDSVILSTWFRHFAPQVTLDMLGYIRTHKNQTWVCAFKGGDYPWHLRFIVQGMNQSGLRKVDTSA